MSTSTASVADQHTIGWRFDNTYAQLPDALFAPAKPTAVREPSVFPYGWRIPFGYGFSQVDAPGMFGIYELRPPPTVALYGVLREYPFWRTVTRP